MKIALSKILCPLDFSDNSAHAMEYAIAFASTYRAELVLLHVIAPPVYAFPTDSIVPEVTAEYVQVYEQASRSRLHEIAETVKPRYARTRELVASGVPFVGIIQVARTEQVDLIVMGTHGRTGLAHVLIGSVADKVVRKAPCPVLTVKNPEHEFVMP